MRTKSRSKLLLLIVVFAALLAIPVAASASTNGTWNVYPGQQIVYQTSVQQPINTDGSSNFKANGKTVIPVKFGLSQGIGPLKFESIYSDNQTEVPSDSPCATGRANDCAFATFTPSGTFKFSDIANLSAKYDFTTGNCWGGSLRWSVRIDLNDTISDPTDDPAVFIYYGSPPNFGNDGASSGCDGTESQSEQNLVGSPLKDDLRFDTTQIDNTFYNTYENIKVLAGDHRVSRVSLVLDSGWKADQKVDLSSATVGVGGANPYIETFTPQPSSQLSSTCPTQEASIKITKMDGVPTGDVNEPISIQPQDNDGKFRIVDCKYMYNLATSSLSGVGTYKAYAVINGVTASNPAVFDLK